MDKYVCMFYYAIFGVSFLYVQVSIQIHKETLLYKAEERGVDTKQRDREQNNNI